MGALLTIIFVFILLGWIFRRLLPVILVRWINKKMGNPMSSKSSRRPEGQVYVSKDSTKNSEKIVEKDMGEYVSFETIKEDKNGNV